MLNLKRCVGRCFFLVSNKDIGTTFFGAFSGIIGTSLSLVMHLYMILLAVGGITLNVLVFGILVFHRSSFMLTYTLSVGFLVVTFVVALIVSLRWPLHKDLIWGQYHYYVALLAPIVYWLTVVLLFGFILMDPVSLHAGSKPSTALVAVEPLDPVVKRTGIVALPGKILEDIPNKALPVKNLDGNANNGASTGASWSDWFWSWFDFTGTKPSVGQKPSISSSSVPADQPLPAASWSDWFWSFFGYNQPMGKPTPPSSPMGQTTGPAMGALAGLPAVIPAEVPTILLPSEPLPEVTVLSVPLESQSLELESLASQLQELRLLWLPQGFLELVTYGEHSCIIVGLDANKPQDFCVVPLYLTLSELKLNTLSFLKYDLVTGSLSYNLADHATFTASVSPSPHELMNDAHLTEDQRAEVLLCYQYYLNVAKNQPVLFMYLHELLYYYNPSSLSMPLLYELSENLAARAVVHQIDCTYFGESDLSDAEAGD